MTAAPPPSEYPAPLYAAVHDGNPGDLEFYRRSCAGAESILELGCGDARVLADLSAATRVGVDLDPGMLELARARDPKLELICADMRSVSAELLGDRRFDRVIVPYGGLYCMLELTHLEQLFATMAGVLGEGGELIFDVWAADAFHADSEPADLGGGWLERVKTIELEGEPWEVLERSEWDKPGQRIDATYVHVRVGSEDAIEGVLRQRYVLVEQLRSLANGAGLEILALDGDFCGSSYDDESELMVVRARRR